MCVRHDLKGCVTNFANVPMIENDGNRKKKITLEKSHNHGVRVTIFYGLEFVREELMSKDIFVK